MVLQRYIVHEIVSQGSLSNLGSGGKWSPPFQEAGVCLALGPGWAAAHRKSSYEAGESHEEVNMDLL